MTPSDGSPSDQEPGGLPDAAFLAAFTRSASGMAVTALDGRVLHANDAFATRVAEAGLRAAPDGGLPAEPIAVPQASPAPQPTGPSDEPDLPSRILLGSVLGAEMQLLRRPDGTPGWWLLTLDLPPRRDTLRDALTGLADRRLLLERVGLALARRQTGSIELVVLDLDGFKTINDEYGHVVGDRVLVEVARRLDQVEHGHAGHAALLARRREACRSRPAQGNRRARRAQTANRLRIGHHSSCGRPGSGMSCYSAALKWLAAVVASMANG